MSRRTEQVGDEIQRVLGEVIQNEVKDPRVGFVTVTGVTVTPDMSRANVRLSIMGGEAERKETMKALERARGFLRRRVGEEVTLRTVPEIVLHLDRSLDHALRITELLRDIEEERRINPPKLDDTE
ncbi:MAG TPA: 30S ribosome-binding factor RbfA [Herpetosiphonaceae bacterium]|jgi:ribosome-binding factor A|nr:30S ribosome-binding factor RbfA [Herpetosiphonaceae bacterium]